jgi:hypothetical protein
VIWIKKTMQRFLFGGEMSSDFDLDFGGAL